MTEAGNVNVIGTANGNVKETGIIQTVTGIGKEKGIVPGAVVKELKEKEEKEREIIGKEKLKSK